MAQKKKRPSLLGGQQINPQAVRGDMTAADLVDSSFLAYNGRRLREACRLFAEKILERDVVVGMSVTGALTPAGLGMSCLIPLIENGFVDWIVSTGANLYHDTHFGIGLKMFQGSPEADDVALRDQGVVRIYDIFFDYHVLLSTDAFFREVARNEEFQHPMGTAEFHYRAGRYVAERERVLKLSRRSLLAAAYEHAVPIYTSSPGDSSIGMNLALLELEGGGLRIDPLTDVNETAAIVYAAKTERREERGVHPRRRLAKEFRPADRAANPGSDGRRGERPRLLPAGDRCAARHRRPFRRDPIGGGELGEN